MGEALDVGASMIRSVLHQTDLTVSSELALAHALKIALAGNVVVEVLAAAAECQTDLIVMARPEIRAFLHALRGSTTERVLRDARCPVLALPGH
jgi:hypothetical protein